MLTKIFSIRLKKPVIFLCAAALLFGVVKFHMFNNIIPVFARKDYPLKGFKIVVDPGHGGVDGGTHFKNKIMEKDLNLDIALKLKDVLKGEGAQVFITRETDTELSHLNSESSSRHQRDLIARLRMIERENPDLFVSIHINSLPSSPVTRGPMVFHAKNKEKSKTLAHFIQESLNNLTIEGDSFEQKKNRFLKRDFFLLRKAPCPGVIIELGFLSNPIDREYLQKENYQYAVAKAIKNGIKRFLFYTQKPRI